MKSLALLLTALLMASAHADPSRGSGIRNCRQSVQLGRWIYLDGRPEREVRALFDDLRAMNALIEAPTGERGFIAEGLTRRPYRVRFLDLMTRRPSWTVTPLVSPTSGRSRVRVLATAKQVPDASVYLLPTDLERDLRETGLSKADVALIRSRSAGVMTFVDFLTAPQWKRSRTDLLLLGNDDRLYRTLAGARRYDVFETIYGQYYADGTLSAGNGPWDWIDDAPQGAVIDRFMKDALTSYSTVVFLLPRDFTKQANLHGRGKGGFTFEEWKWLRRNRDQLARVVFVVGADRAIPPDFSTDFVGPGGDRRRREIRDLMIHPNRYVLK